MANSKSHYEDAVDHTAYEIAETILAAASEPVKVPEVCVWTRCNDKGVFRRYDRSCGPEGYGMRRTNMADLKYCPYCGKSISVREG